MAEYRYMVRPLGGCAWTSCRTVKAARREAEIARDRGLRGVVIADRRTGEVVPPPVEEAEAAE